MQTPDRERKDRESISEKYIPEYNRRRQTRTSTCGWTTTPRSMLVQTQPERERREAKRSIEQCQVHAIVKWVMVVYVTNITNKSKQHSARATTSPQVLQITQRAVSARITVVIHVRPACCSTTPNAAKWCCERCICICCASQWPVPCFGSKTQWSFQPCANSTTSLQSTGKQHRTTSNNIEQDTTSNRKQHRTTSNNIEQHRTTSNNIEQHQSTCE